MRVSELSVTVMPALFVVGFTLLGWNIIIWKQTAELRDDVYSISTEMRRNAKMLWQSQNRFEEALPRDNEAFDNDEVQHRNKEYVHKSESLLRKKRSNADVPVPATAEPSNTGTTTKKPKRKRKNKRRGSKGRRANAQRMRNTAAGPPAPKNVAAAFHVVTSTAHVNYGVITSWRAMNGLSVANFDASQLANGRIQVLKSGVYYVYGKVVFANVRSGQKKFAHLVAAEGETSEQISSCVVAPNSGRESQFLSCSLSGMIRLKVGQTLRINVNPTSCSLYSLHPATYFGGFWIGD